MSRAPTGTLKRRLHGIRLALEERSLQALVVTALPNVQYLTNFNGSAGILIVTAERPVFVTDSRYVAAVAETRGTPYELADAELAVVEGSYDATLADILREGSSKRIGFEAAHLSVSRHAWLRAALDGPPSGPELVPTEGIVERARATKDAYELSVLRVAARRLSDVAEMLISEVRPGTSEREVARAIDWRILQAGFEKTAFDTIVASGSNAALPHARPGERKLTEGDLVVLDFGGVYDSYCVDLTRTVVIGPSSPRTREVYRAVAEAQSEAIRTVRPGVSRFAIDGAARDRLAAAGMADAFGHGTGHGLGLEVHEDPKISKRRPDSDARDEAVLPGMVFTIEPGAYFPGWGGVRIEDDVLVTEDGVEVLTHAARELIEI
jgi:Xaa-Pro aminopeptidase